MSVNAVTGDLCGDEFTFLFARHPTAIRKEYGALIGGDEIS